MSSKSCRAVLFAVAVLSAGPLGALQERPTTTAKPSSRAGARAKQPGVLTLRELFGFGHPIQTVEFDVDAPPALKSGFIRCSTGEQTPFQVLSGKRLALLTDLPANATKTWKISDAKGAGAEPEEPPAEETATETKPETKPEAKPAPAKAKGAAPAPVPVTVTRAGPCFRILNGLTGVLIPAGGEGFGGTPAPLQGLRWRDGTWTGTGPNLLKSGPRSGPAVSWLERGPVKVVARLDYGAYTCTVEVQAGQPSILLEDEGTANVEYSFNLAAGLEPDEGRYHIGRGERVVKLDVGNAKQYGRMAIWDPWAEQGNRGDGWQLYNTKSGDSANVFAMYGGRASRIILGNNGGPEVFTAPADASGKPAAGVVMKLNGGGRPARLPWNLFVGVKGQDWKPDPKFVETNDPSKIQGFVKQYNLLSGINLTKLVRYQLEDYPDPARGYGAMFMPKEAVAQVIQRAKIDNAFFQRLMNDGYNRPLFEMWKNPNPQTVKRVVDSILYERSPYPMSALNALEGYVNGWGFWNMAYWYWIGGGGMSNKMFWIDQALSMGPMITPDEKVRIKATAALFAGILWDDDFVPLGNASVSGLNLGTPNMPIQQTGMRNSTALFLTDHPLMKDRLPGIPAQVKAVIESQVNEHGAHIGCTHYIGASMWPTLNTVLQLKAAGIADLFKTEPRLRKFAEFYMQICTPVDPRVGMRHMLPVGDSEVADNLLLCGMLATGYADVDPVLAGRLMSIWRATGEPHDSFYGHTAVKIDERIPSKDAQLASDDFPGYMTVLRSGWGTKSESALWFINGDYYKDHYHNDKGEVILFAHGAPLSLDFASMYSPRSAGGMQKSRLLPPNLNWKGSPASVPEEAGNWGNSKSFGFKAVGNGGYGSATFRGYGGEWTRAVSLADLGDQPVFAIQDSFTKGPLVFSLNLMNQGPVETPDGPKSPGQGFSLKAGLNRLAFTGQTFDKHPSKGIDGEIYVICAEPMEGALSEWSHNNRIPERQSILRFKGNGGFRVVVVPYPKGQKPDVQVKADADSLDVSVKGKSVNFAKNGAFSGEAARPQAPSKGSSPPRGSR